MNISIIKRCPYCAKIIQSNEFSRDHVFIQALGGRAQVASCRRCNSKIGSEVEGELQRPNTILNLIKQIRGFGTAVRATLEIDNAEIEHNLHTNEIRARNPVERTRTGNSIDYKIEGSPAQVRSILRKFDLDSSAIENMITTASAKELVGAKLRIDIGHDIYTAERLAAKVALGAGVLLGDSSFIDSQLADNLRKVLWGEMSVLRRMELDVIRQWDERIQEQLKAVNADPIVSMQPGGQESQVIFSPSFPVGKHQATAVIVHVSGFPICLTGSLYSGAAPLRNSPLAGGLPILVRDAASSAEIHLIHREFAESLALAHH